MKILKTLVSIEGEGNLYTCDTIQYEGKMWLVPQWIDTLGTGKSMPVRIIQLDVLPHQKSSFAGHDFVLTYPIPKAVFSEGRIPSGSKDKYIVIEKPHIYQGSDSIH